MNVTSQEKQIQILKMLVEGNSIRSIERMTDVHRDTITRLMIRIGENCQKLIDTRLRGFHCKEIQVDEIWTFVKKKQKRLKEKERLDHTIGDQYVFVAIDANTKLIPTFTVGKRDSATTFRFIIDLYDRLKGNGRIQITSDGFKPYIEAIEQEFGADVDFAQLIKFF
ncbi:hypothetical protein KA005_84635, partial [bacterium]|nr:hypothetical protein [bacterium]